MSHLIDMSSGVRKTGICYHGTQVAGWVKKPAYISTCMHNAGAPCRYKDLNFPVDADTVRWAITNCHLMRNRFSIIDLLHFTGIWSDAFVQMVLDRAEAIDAGL